jgi:hypothetical protein
MSCPLLLLIGGVVEEFRPQTATSDCALPITYAFCTLFHQMPLATYLGLAEAAILAGTLLQGTVLIWDDAHVMHCTWEWIKRNKAVSSACK